MDTGFHSAFRKKQTIAPVDVFPSRYGSGGGDVFPSRYGSGGGDVFPSRYGSGGGEWQRGGAWLVG